MQTHLNFDDSSYVPGVPAADQKRLAGQGRRVWNVLRDGRWRTLAEIAEATARYGGKDSEAGISARLRDFRKPRWGSHRVERRRRHGTDTGLFEYQLVMSRNPLSEQP